MKHIKSGIIILFIFRIILTAILIISCDILHIASKSEYGIEDPENEGNDDNNDDLPILEILSDKTTAEEKAKDQVTITFERNDSEGDLTVNYEIQGTASEEDYTTSTELTGSIIIPDRKTKQTVTISIENDILHEEDEKLEIKLIENDKYKLTSQNSITISIIENPLIAHWDFNGQTMDQSRHGYDLVIENNAKLTDPAKEGNQCLQFNHDNHSYAECESVFLSDQFTITGLFYLNDINWEWTYLITNSQAQGDRALGFSISVKPDIKKEPGWGYLRFQTFDGEEEEKVAYSKDFHFTSNIWTHFAVAADKTNNNCQIFLNGVELTEVNEMTVRFHDNFDLRLGLSKSGYYPLNGKLDDIRIYNYKLTQEEIKNIIE